MSHGHFRAYVDHYFAPHPSREVKELFISRTIMDFAVGAATLFEPLFLYKIGFTIPDILIFFGVMYIFYALLLPIGGRLCHRHGNEHTMLFSSPFLVIYYLALLATAYNRYYAVVAILALATQKILYWPGYHANFAAWSSRVEDGREVSNAAVLSGLANVLAPAFGGAIIMIFGYPTMLLTVALLILLSNLPLLSTPELLAPRPFSYWGAWRRLFAKENRQLLFSFFGFGEELIAMVAWPLYIATILTQAVTMGAVISLAKLADVLAVLYVGRVSDEEGENKPAVVRSGALYTALSWLVRPVMVGGLGIFLIDSFYRIAREAVGVPLVAIAYEEAQDHVVMEKVVVMQMALALGKVVAAFAGAAVMFLWPGTWAALFMMGAAFTVFYSLISRPAPAR